MSPSHPYFDYPGPLALAHRGFSRDGVENSLAAFAAAVELGYRYVETDVRATRDEVAVAFHDPTLDRVTDMSGAIADLPWAAVQQARIKGAEPVPLIDDLLGTWPDLRVNIDVKTTAAAASLVKAIERTRAHDRVCIASFSDARRREVTKRLSAPVATSAGRQGVALLRFAGVWADRWLRDVDCFQVPEYFGSVRVVTPASLAAAHNLGKEVHVWTVNEAAEMNRLLDLGVDGIVTDRADTLKDVLIDRGEWQP